MLVTRNTDLPNSPHFSRTPRVLISDDGYFYKTREGEMRGAFASESIAMDDLKVFIKVMAIEAALEKTDLFKIA